VKIQILGTSGDPFQNGVQTHSQARTACSCFVNKLKISLFDYQGIILFVQINANFCYHYFLLLEALIHKCAMYVVNVFCFASLQHVPFLFRVCHTVFAEGISIFWAKSQEKVALTKLN